MTKLIEPELDDIAERELAIEVKDGLVMVSQIFHFGQELDAEEGVYFPGGIKLMARFPLDVTTPLEEDIAKARGTFVPRLRQLLQHLETDWKARRKQE